MKRQLHVAVIEGKIEVVSDLITQGFNVNRKDNYGTIPLELAAESQNVEILKLLLDSGGKLNEIKNDKITSLLIDAIKSRNVNFLKLLLDADADVRAKDQDQKHQKLLELAIKSRNSDSLKVLIDAGFDVNQKYSDQQTPLLTAAKSGNSTLVKLLLDAGATVNVKNNYDATPLHLAVESENVDVCKLLINAYADINAENKYKDTPLIHAVYYENEVITKLLLDAGVDPNDSKKFDRTSMVVSENNQYFTPLHLAATGTNSNILKLLINAGANLNAQDYYGNTPLHKAVEAKNFELLKILIDAGANVNKINNFGCTALGFLVEEVNDELSMKGLKLLIECTDVNLTNTEGENVLVNDLKILNDNCNSDSESDLEEMKRSIEVIYEHVAIMKALDLQINRCTLDFISQSNYFIACLAELKKAKAMKLRNCCVTFFNLLVDDKRKLVKYAGNYDLVKDFKKNIHNFVIYGAMIKNKMMKGIKGRKFLDEAANLLTYYLPIFNPTHLIIRNIFDVLSEKDWNKLCEKKRCREL